MTQISATISAETKERIERYVEAHGVKKSQLIETALMHYLSALEQVPVDVMISPVLVVSRDSGQKVLDRI